MKLIEVLNLLEHSKDVAALCTVTVALSHGDCFGVECIRCPLRDSYETRVTDAMTRRETHEAD